MTEAQVLAALRRANAVARASMAAGRHPFGAVLVAPDGDTVLLEQGNVDTVRHAESELAREAAQRFDAETLWRCTLVTTVEPCAMCAATQYWAHIGSLVYGLDGAKDIAPWTVADKGPDRVTLRYDNRRGGYGYAPSYRSHRSAWREGQRYPYYGRSGYVISDYRAYRLPPPRPGYRYYRGDNGDVVMVAIASGLIGAIIGNALSDR